MNDFPYPLEPHCLTVGSPRVNVGRNQVFTALGPFDEDNGEPDLCTGSPTLQCFRSGIEKKNWGLA